MKTKIAPLICLSCWALLLTAAQCCSAQVYRGMSVDGTVVLSNFRSSEARELLISAPEAESAGEAPPVTPARTDSAIPNAFKTMVEDAARQHGLDPNLLHAMIRVESGYNPRALSAKGARGLMQLMPATARRFGVADAFNPKENVRAGAEYVQWLLNLFQGDVELALAAYNAGENAVIRAGYRIPPYGETRSYVPKVLAHYR